MNKRFFLSYSRENYERIEESVRYAVVLHVHANQPQNLRDDAEIGYEVDLSMREWGFSWPDQVSKSRSKWAVVNGGLMLDSVMRDQHVVAVTGLGNDPEYLRISFDVPTTQRKISQLYSLSNFEHRHHLYDLSLRARSQVRWLSVPGTKSEGVLFSSKGSDLEFIPLIVDSDSSAPFTKGRGYDMGALFKHIKDLRFS